MPGMGLAGGYAAGGVKDALLEIVKQRMLEQELQQRAEEQAFQRTRAQQQDERAAKETEYQHGQDAVTNARLADQAKRQADTDQRTTAKDQLAAMQGRPFSELVDPATQGLNEKATPAIGLPPLPGTNVMGVSPPAVRQGKVRSVRIGDWDARPDTREDVNQRLDEATMRTILEREASVRPKEPPGVGSFEDFVTRTYGPNPTSQQIVQARKDYGQADDAARSAPPVVRIQTVDADGNPITRVLTREQAAGQEFAAAPTTDTRNRQAAVGRSSAVLQSIAELSEKINTGQGVLAKMAGGAAKLEAQANLNDDVSEYQALVQMFTPLLARAVGHTGVLTEQDVASVRSGLPQPGDSKSVRDRKMARITKIMQGMDGSADEPAKTPNSGAGGRDGGAGGVAQGGKSDPLGIRQKGGD